MNPRKILLTSLGKHVYFIYKKTDIEGIENPFPRQRLKRFTFCVKLSDSMFFLLGLFPIIN